MLCILQVTPKNIEQIAISFGAVTTALNNLNFKWEKCWVNNFREYIENKNNSYSLKPHVLDETWVFSTGACRKRWLCEIRVRKSLIFKSSCTRFDKLSELVIFNAKFTFFLCRWFKKQLLLHCYKWLWIMFCITMGLLKKIQNQSSTKTMLLEYGCAEILNIHHQGWKTNYGI